MKNKKVLYGVLAVLIIIVGIYPYSFVKEKMRKVELGLSQSTFPYKDYTAEELEKLFPQIKYADVPTRVTPEETYSKFREALKDNDLDMAIEQLSEEAESYTHNLQVLTEAFHEGKFVEAYDSYPEEILQESMYESIASYYYLEYRDGHNLENPIGFQKDKNGDWKLSSL